MCSMSLSAAETLLIGEVYDARTGEPVVGANVYFRGTKIGTSTNGEGLFFLRVDMVERHTLVVSAVGYRKQRFEIMPGMQSGLDVALEERTEWLSEVRVLPTDEQVKSLMDSVRANRQRNDRQHLGEQEDTYREQRSLMLSDIQSRHLERALWRSLQAGMFTAEDSTLLLPLYAETSEVKMRSGGLSRTISEQRALLHQVDYENLLSLTDAYANFYRTSVPLMGQAFVSPLAAAANNHYQFYLADSIAADTLSGLPKAYIVHFRTRNGYFATFNGEMVVDSGSWGLRSVHAQVPREVNLNYLHALTINQVFAADRTLLREQVSAILDMGVKTDSSHLFPSLLIQRERMLAGEPPALRQERDTLAKESSSQRDMAVQREAMEQLEQMPLVRTAQWIAAIINTGYIPTGTKVDIGKAAEILQVNHYEGVHVGLPLRTNEKLWKRVSLEAYVGYGFRDQALKGMGQLSVQLPVERRQLLSLRYEDHYTRTESSAFDRMLRENSIGFGEMDFTAYAFDGLPYNNKAVHHTAVRERVASLTAESDWREGVETTLRLRVGRMDPTYPFTNQTRFVDCAYPFDPFRFQSLSAVLRLGWHEGVVDLYMRRIHQYSRFPTVFVGAEIGSVEPVESASGSRSAYSMYGHLHLTVRQQLSFPVGGSLSYAATAGLVLGKVPYPLLNIFDGNTGYMYDPLRFTLMHNHQYAADRYLTLQAEWNGMGVLFNRIPGVRFLHLRELVETKVAWGGLSTANKATDGTLQDLHVPYVEVGVGLGNILRVLDLYSVWRVTHRDDPTAPRWAIRGRLHISL